MEKLKSKYILHQIFLFIQDEQFINKIFKYSKLYQKYLDLDYIKLIFVNRNINFDDYLLDENSNRFNNDLKEFMLEPDKIKKYIFDYYSNYPSKNIQGFNIYEFSLDINILSPLIDILAKEDFFCNLFNIVINLNEINNNENFIKKFELLNRENVKYVSLKLLIEEFDVNKFKNIGINFNNITKLEIPFLKENNYLYNKEHSKNILSFFVKSKAISNLLYLKLKCDFKDNYNYDMFIKILFNDVDKFKSLKTLELSNFHFHENTILLQLYDLEKLILNNCSDIFLDEGVFSKLKNLSLNKSYCRGDNLSTKFPELENCSFNTYFQSLDFESSQKIKFFEGYVNTFSKIQKQLLEKVYILDSIITDDLLNCLKMITSCENIQEFSISYSAEENNKEFEYFQKNEKIKKVELKIYSNNEKICYDFQNKFPNLTDISFWIRNYLKGSSHIKINENAYSKVNKIQLNVYGSINIELNCQSYESLESFKLSVDDETNLTESIPIFNEKCDCIFKSLKILDLSFIKNKKNDKDELNNLYNNIDKNKLPNLTEFYILSSFNQGNMFYKKFIGKIISLNSIRKINMQRTTNKCNENFSRKELKVLFPNACLYKLKEVNIENYKESFIKNIYYKLFNK